MGVTSIDTSATKVVATERSRRLGEAGDRASGAPTELDGSNNKEDSSQRKQKTKTRRSKSSRGHRHPSQHHHRHKSLSDPSPFEQDSKKASCHHRHHRNDQNNEKNDKISGFSSIEEKKRHHKKKKSRSYSRIRHHDKDRSANKDDTSKTPDKNDSDSSNLFRQKLLKYAPMWTEDIDSFTCSNTSSSTLLDPSSSEATKDGSSSSCKNKDLLQNDPLSPRQEVQETFKQVYQILDQELLKQTENVFSLDDVHMSRHASGLFVFEPDDDELTMT